MAATRRVPREREKQIGMGSVQGTQGVRHHPGSAGKLLAPQLTRSAGGEAGVPQTTVPRGRILRDRYV